MQRISMPYLRPLSGTHLMSVAQATRFHGQCGGAHTGGRHPEQQRALRSGV